MTLSSSSASRFISGNQGTSTQANGARSASANREYAKLNKAAGEFESILLNSLWKSMKQTFQDDDDSDSDRSMESFDDLGMQAMTNAVGNAGGLGIKRLVMNYLEPANPAPQGSGPVSRADGGDGIRTQHTFLKDD